MSDITDGVNEPPQWYMDNLEALRKMPKPSIEKVRAQMAASARISKDMNQNKKYINPAEAKLVDLVRDNKKVNFLFYRDATFYYEQEDGFVFPVSLEEANVGRATFLAEDKAIYFMRWMKKYIEECKKGEAPKGLEHEQPPTGTYTLAVPVNPPPAKLHPFL